jgi:hypothetical protein
LGKNPEPPRIPDMSNWMQILETAVEVGVAFSLGNQIGKWANMEPQAGDRAVRAYVESSTVTAVDAMDAAFFDAVQFAVTPAQRVRLLRLYAYFKVVEFARFGEFRGFPQT